MDFHRIKSILEQQHNLPHDGWKGAVLFLANEEHVIFIKRSEKMPTHGGQMAFVGGHKHASETDPWITVQREYNEETGLATTDLEFLGYLPAILTARLQPIIPVMARLTMPIDQFLQEVRSNGEWDDIVVYPWRELSKEENWNFAWRHGHVRGPIHFHTIKPDSYLPACPRSHLLWGATASMVWDFLRLYFKQHNKAY